MGKKIALDAKFKIVKVPLPPEKLEAWKAAMMLLLEWIREAAGKENDPPSKNELASGN
ncbi:MAG: hypothetical protein IT315_06785 [Anaerolineales bacterium]|nr:hypothetical protein [Anaerolineales bacterium]